MSAGTPVRTGTRLPSRTFVLTRADLVRYAGASGDFNPIHYSDTVAASVGLPGVIGHGMLTMGAALRTVNDWTGDPGSVRSYSTRFNRPVPVPEGDTGVEITVEGVVSAVEADSHAQVELTVRCAGQKVLTRTRVVVALPSGSID